MGIIVDLYPAPPRRLYQARPNPAEAESAARSSRRFNSARADAPLRCLAGGTLAARFHAWHGRSGRRYVCSVYPVDPEARSAGLPDFENAVVIGVAIDSRGERRVAEVFELSSACGRLAGDAEAPRRARAFRAALAAKAREWHVHLLARSPEARCAAIRDLETR